MDGREILGLQDEFEATNLKKYYYKGDLRCLYNDKDLMGTGSIGQLYGIFGKRAGTWRELSHNRLNREGEARHASSIWKINKIDKEEVLVECIIVNGSSNQYTLGDTMTLPRKIYFGEL